MPLHYNSFKELLSNHIMFLILNKFNLVYRTIQIDLSKEMKFNSSYLDKCFYLNIMIASNLIIKNRSNNYEMLEIGCRVLEINRIS